MDTGHFIPFDPPMQISNSSLGLFNACPAKFEFRKVILHQADRENSFDAQIGTALHRALQTYLATGDENRAVFDLAVEYPWEMPVKDTKKTIYACISTLAEMVKSFNYREYDLVLATLPDGSPATEVGFSIEFERYPGLRYIGYIDAIMMNKLDGKMLVLDIKTTGREKPIERWRFDHQMIPYGFVLQEVLGDVAIFDTIYLDTVVDLQEPKSKVVSFSRGLQEVADWLLAIDDFAVRYKRYMTLERFPRSSGSCVAYNRLCPFYDECHFPQRQSLIDMHAIKKEDTVPPPPTKKIHYSIKIMEADYV